MRLSYSASRNIILALSFVGLIIFYVGMRASSLPASYLSLLIVPIGFVFFVTLIEGKQIKKNEASFLAFFLILLLATGAFVYTPSGVSLSTGGIAASLVIVSAYLMARALISHNLAYHFSAAAFWVVAVPVLWIIVKEQTPLALRQFFVSSSENAVSAWLIFTSAAMAVVKYNDKREYSFIPLLISFIVAYFLYTRASIVVAFLSIALMAYARFGLARSILFTLIIGGIVGSVGMGIYLDALEQTKFGTRGFDSPRWVIWLSYLRDLTGVSLIIGNEVSHIPEIHAFSDNPHSSLIRFHSFFGIIPLFIGICFIFILLKRARIFFFFMFFIILLRASTDTLLFGLFYDIFLMITLVIAFQRSNARLRKDGIHDISYD
ncbi:hypothetical protein DFO67_102111 [Modicisalibacter xianhensis]|uniref:O-antigen ligase n=1 Tax=Modicisalibacter xianhensis TaxID=442341 RepID=A0A4R8G9H4_9GAMM|nr:hypothetical protein [Halomonas xianhensis]TDX32162.1 hypothetical protein DFO67_102111 [Halomonas xianhensis]